MPHAPSPVGPRGFDIGAKRVLTYVSIATIRARLDTHVKNIDKRCHTHKTHTLTLMSVVMTPMSTPVPDLFLGQEVRCVTGAAVLTPILGQRSRAGTG